MAGGRVPSDRQGQVSEIWESLYLTRESFWSARSLLDGLLYWDVCHEPWPSGIHGISNPQGL